MRIKFFFLVFSSILFLTSCYTIKYQETNSSDSFSNLCDNIKYIKRSYVKKVSIINCDTTLVNYAIEKNLIGRSGLDLGCDTIVLKGKDFQYYKLLEMERAKLNDPDIVITNLIWDFKKDLRWLLFRYASINAVSYDVVKCNKVKFN